MDAADIAAIIAAAGGGWIIPQLGKRALDKLSKRGEKRRNEVDRAWRRADREAQKRRLIEEHASHVRRLLFAAPCVEASDIPAFPNYARDEPGSTSKEDS